jgi:Tol biopolymer transport system component
MDPDGGNLKQLTEGPGDLFPQTSPDGRWVVFSFPISAHQLSQGLESLD